MLQNSMNVLLARVLRIEAQVDVAFIAEAPGKRVTETAVSPAATPSSPLT